MIVCFLSSTAVARNIDQSSSQISSCQLTRRVLDMDPWHCTAPSILRRHATCLSWQSTPKSQELGQSASVARIAVFAAVFGMFLSCRHMRKRTQQSLRVHISCGLFWKAFGIVCLIFFVWQSVKLVWWLVTVGHPILHTPYGSKSLFYSPSPRALKACPPTALH